jgi:hypothetical protein
MKTIVPPWIRGDFRGLQSVFADRHFKNPLWSPLSKGDADSMYAQPKGEYLQRSTR